MKTVQTALRLVFFLACLIQGGQAAAQGKGVPDADDPHYTDVGFFDIHVCNWPGQPLFFKSIFSTTQYASIEKIEVLYPDGAMVTTMDLAKYRLAAQAGKSEKRVYMKDSVVPPHSPEGWYSARITMNDGKIYTARDFVSVKTLPLPGKTAPPPDAHDIALPAELSWDAVEGAKHYQVFIRDLWDGEKLIFSSEILDKPKVALPPGLLVRGGLYSWRIHARDVNEDKALGDFNHGSLGREQQFSIAQ
jgi:hypothetical protein